MSTIKFSPTEETSIILNGNFNEDAYSKNLKSSLNKSLALETKLPNEIKFMSIKKMTPTIAFIPQYLVKCYWSSK